MRRRTLLRRISAASAATTVAAGQVAAGQAAAPVVELDREIDVSDVSGRVPLDQLLTDREVSRVTRRVDGATELVVPAGRTVLASCINCCGDEDNGCGSCIPDCDSSSPRIK